MKTIYFNQVLTQIKECERKIKLYNTLYVLLSCPGFDQKDFDMVERDEIDNALAKGEIKSLADLGKIFDDLSDDQYRAANRLLKTDLKRAI